MNISVSKYQYVTVISTVSDSKLLLKDIDEYISK